MANQDHIRKVDHETRRNDDRMRRKWERMNSEKFTMGAVAGQSVHCYYRGRDVIVDSVIGEYCLGRRSGVGRAAPSIVVNGMVLVRLMVDTRAQVARRYGVAPATVTLWRRAVEGLRVDSENWQTRNVDPRGRTAEILEDMPGMTAKEIAEKYDMSVHAVYQLSARWGVKCKRGGKKC